MKHSTIIAVAAGIVCSLMIAAPSRTEYVFLKDGAIVDCVIQRDMAESIVVKQKDGAVRTISRDAILRIQYTELYMGRVMIEQTDGLSFEGHIVNDDGDAYLVRTDIARPEERSIRKRDVARISRENPDGLRGSYGDGKIRLEWNRPFTRPARYHVYVRGPGEDGFRRIDTTGRTRFTVDDVRADASYAFRVTAEKNDVESIPSNEISVFTGKLSVDEASSAAPLRLSMDELTRRGAAEAHIFLRDGQIENGTLTAETPAVYRMTRFDGKPVTVPKRSVLRVIYRKMYLGMAYIRLTTGKVLGGFIVDEDRNTVTYRRDLFRPEEKKIPRKDIVFISQSGPTNLKGEAGQTEIALTWDAPYTPVKHYRIFTRTPEAPEYAFAARSGDNRFTLRKMKSNTEYAVIVTAVGLDDNESFPTNAVRVTTKNIPPEAPTGLTKEKTPDPGSSAFSLRITWNPSRDPDGAVVRYHVYRDSGKGYARIASPTVPEYIVSGLDPGELHSFYVLAEDDRGALSEKSATADTGTDIEIIVRAEYLQPLGDFANLFGGGYGGTVTVAVREPFVDNLDIGLTTGYWLFTRKRESVKSAFAVPALLSARYRFRLAPWLSLAPSISAGVSYFSVTYEDAVVNESYENIAGGGAVNALVTGGCTAYFHLGGSVSLQVGVEAGAFIETNLYPFAMGTIGIGIVF
ncbi:MAG TPA: fibronectin type III domain-containing protein [Candidatus Latescibacteria bacterium]|nr:fibronectin type III domain-containing protein [Candidatus Latescibacterota bacterium]